MLHATAAIGDFMLILLTSALWVGSGFVAAGLACCGAFGGLFYCARRSAQARRRAR